MNTTIHSCGHPAIELTQLPTPTHTRSPNMWALSLGAEGYCEKRRIHRLLLASTRHNDDNSHFARVHTRVVQGLREVLRAHVARQHMRERLVHMICTWLNKHCLHKLVLHDTPWSTNTSKYLQVSVNRPPNHLTQEGLYCDWRQQEWTFPETDSRLSDTTWLWHAPTITMSKGHGCMQETHIEMLLWESYVYHVEPSDIPILTAIHAHHLW